jgi:hypothetical protein
MMGLTRRLGALVAVLVLWAAGPVAAQENLDKGKTPAQLYASDCAICHKSPHGLAKGVGRRLDSFLRAHYTASREVAAAISAYLQAIDRQPAPGRESSSKRKAKASTPKLPPRKPPEGKSSETKSSETKASDTKPAESRPSESKAKATASEHEEAKTSSPKASGAKPVEHKPAAAQPAEAKAQAPKADPSKPAQDSKDAKDTKADKSD